MIPTLIKCLCNNKNSFNRLKLIFPIDLCVSVQPYEMRHDGIGNNPSLAVVFAEKSSLFVPKTTTATVQTEKHYSSTVEAKGGEFQHTNWISRELWPLRNRPSRWKIRNHIQKHTHTQALITDKKINNNNNKNRVDSGRIDASPRPRC